MRGIPVVLAAGVLVIGVAGCSGSAASSSSPADAPAAAVSAAPASAPPCDTTGISDAIATAIAPEEVLVSLDGAECSGDFAYAFATTGPADGNPDQQIGVTIVLRTDGSTWTVQNADAVCGTAEITDGPAPYPSDATVPEDIWQNACQTN